MKSDQDTGLLALANPADVELQAALDSLLRGLLTEPGSLVNPLYVGPLRQADLLAREVDRVAGALGLTVVPMSELGWRDAAQTGVSLLNEREATRVAKYGARLPSRVQIVIWGRQGAAELTGGLQEWVAQGLEIDPELDARAYEPRAIAEAVRALGGMATKQPRCVVWVGEAEGAAARAMEVRLRWGGEAKGGVQDIVAPSNPARGGEAPGCVLLSLAGALGAPAAARAWEQVRSFLQRDVPVVVVTDTAGETALRGLPNGPLPDEARWIRDPSPITETLAVRWPPLVDLLLGRPQIGEWREGTIELPLRETTIIEVLREAASWQQSGTFVIFEPGRLGWLKVSNGEIRGARRVQERQEAGTAAETVARIRDMARWPEARLFFIPRDDAADLGGWSSGCRIPLNAVAFDLATAGRGSSGFASFEQTAGEVAEALAAWGLVHEAVLILRDTSRRSEVGAMGHFLLGHFRAETLADQAVESFRDAVRFAMQGDDRDAKSELALDSALNALLVEVRADLRSPSSAWRVLEVSGYAELAALGESAGRVRLVLELAVRAGAREAAERYARWLVARDAGNDLTTSILRPASAPSALAAPGAPPPREASTMDVAKPPTASVLEGVA